MLTQSSRELKRSKYRVLGLVGQGQFGKVFCAVHRQTGHLVALKNLEQQRFSTHKFLRELRFLISLQHPNIVTCQALEHTATGRYLVMDYCEGGTLRSLMSEECGLSVSQSLKLVADILAGLEHAHSRGVVHCDIKPENILLNLQPTGWTARISDFGIARLSQELTSTEAGNTGSPAYMAPERFYGQYAPASDLYSVGIILFELLTGNRPFSGTPIELMSAHLNHPVQPDCLPEIWRPLVLTALQKLMARRFRSATEMLATLRSIVDTANVTSGFTAQSIYLPTLSPDNLPTVPFEAERQERLSRQVQCVAIEHSSLLTHSTSTEATLFRAEVNQVIATVHSKANRQSHERHIPLPTQVRQLLPRPQGCFAIAQDGVYLLPSRAATNPQLITALDHNSQVAIDPTGCWLAQASVDSEIGTLRFQSLSPLRIAQRQSTVTVTSQLLWLAAKEQCQLLQIIALDSRHVAVISHSDRKIGTRIEVFTRRGNRVGSLTATVSMGQAITTPTLYRLLAIDQDHPQSLLLIDLKPFRITRLRVNLVSQFLTASEWGYSVTNAEGHMILLDVFGQQFSQIQIPTRPTAIASTSLHGLAIATWSDNQGSLYSINLRNLDAGLLF